MASPGNKITTAQLYALIQAMNKRLKYLEKVVEACCKPNTSFSTGFDPNQTTSNTGGYGSSPASNTSSGIGSMMTSGTGSVPAGTDGFGAR